MPLPIYLKLFVILYADDTVLMAESDSELQTLLDTFYRYCITWKMKVNVDKTKIMIFSKGRMPVNLQLRYNGKDIEPRRNQKEFDQPLWTNNNSECKSHLQEGCKLEAADNT